MKKFSDFSITTISIGLSLTLAIALITFLWPKSTLVVDSLFIALIGIAITLAFELRLKLIEVEHLIADSISERSKLQRIIEHSQRDVFFSRRFLEVEEEINDLAMGRYQIQSLSALYDNDINSINLLRQGDRLFSTCPISVESREAALEQIGDPSYVGSIDAHLAAVLRGVVVTRIYLFKSYSLFDQAALKDHLMALKNGGIEIRVVLREIVHVDTEFDFLVFGERKVSVGVVDPDSGIVRGGRISVDQATVDRYIRDYEQLRRISQPLEQMLALSTAPARAGLLPEAKC